MDPFKEGEWVILHQLNNKKLARIGRKGFANLGKDFVSLEGAIGCLPWTKFKMELNSGPKSGKRMFKIAPLEADGSEGDDEMNPCEKDLGEVDEEDRDNRTINDDGNSQGLSATEIEALRDGGLTGKEIVNHLVANSSTYDRKTRYAQSKYLKRKESKHCLREEIIIRRTTLSSVVEVLCSGGGGEGSRGAISGMRPDTLSQMLTALNIQWRRIPSVKQTSTRQPKLASEKGGKVSACVKKTPDGDSSNQDGGATLLESTEGGPKDEMSKVEDVKEGCIEDVSAPVVNTSCPSGTTYLVYESGNWGLLVASLLTLLPVEGPRLIHLYPGHGVPCLIAPRALNIPHEKFSILSSVNFKALLEQLGKSGDATSISDEGVKLDAGRGNHLFNNGENSGVMVDPVLDAMKEETEDVPEEDEGNGSTNQTACNDADVMSKAPCENRKRKMEVEEQILDCSSTEMLAKKPRWQLEAETAADLLTSSKADGLIVVASREQPVSIVLSLLPYLAPSRPLVVYCPHREPLLDLYAVLKGWEPWVTRYGKCGGKDGVPRVANLRVVENWLRSYQVLPNRTHPKVNMTPGGGFILTGIVIDFSDS